MNRRLNAEHAPGKWARLSVITAVVAALVLAVWATGGRAATPASGTVTAANTDSNPVTYTAGPFVVANVTGLAAQQCNAATQCDDFRLKVDVPDGLLDAKQVRVTVQWANSAADFDVSAFKLNANGTPGERVASSGTSADPEVMILPAVKGDYLIRVVPFNPLGESINTRIVFEDKPSNFTPASGPAPQFVNYPATGDLGTDSGEPSLGINWKTGNVMFIAGLQTLRARFDDTATPARATWEDKSAVLTSLSTLDPILYTDSKTGRTIVSQLAGTDSLSAFTDDDGETWVPNEGGPLTSGVDHQTIGGGPFAPPLAGGTAAYPNAVYYCSQDLYTAFCARSDDGGLTYGPTVPMYTLECGGIHGHVKVAADGTVYMPNRQCGSNQGLAVSEDNGVTWVVRKVPGSLPGDWDPSVGIGSDGTIYFGYDYADGRPHVAVSRDKGVTWSNDQAVGRVLNLRDSAFPAVVAGDGDRAAFAFLGTTETRGSQTAQWHLYVATTYDRGHSWSVADATPYDPVQLGTLCSDGINCGNDRNLLDFMDVQTDADGRVLVGYADGCVAGCVDNYSSRSAKATIARQQCGPGLFAAKGASVGNCAAAPTPTPTPQLVTSCDGANVITDAEGDARNPAPGSAGPTDQADITGVSFEKSGANLVVKMRLKNLTPLPLAGSTFTSYYVAWRSSDGNYYAVETDVNGPEVVAYGYGPFDPDEGITDYNGADGAMTTGANGVIAVTVPLASVGNPTIPVADATSTPAVWNPYAYVISGEGVLGSGATFTDTVDRAPDAGYGGRWAVCGAGTPTPTPAATPSACAAPGVTVVTDNTQNDAADGVPSHDIVSASVSHPFTGSGDPDKLVFTMKVASLAALTPSSFYFTSFTVDGAAEAAGSVYGVRMVVNETGGVAFESYKAGASNGGTVDGRFVDASVPAEAGSKYNADGTITVVVRPSDVGVSPGHTLTRFNGGVAQTAAGVATAVVDWMPSGTATSVPGRTTSTSFTVRSNQTCDPSATPTPTATPTATATPSPTPTPADCLVPTFGAYMAPDGMGDSWGEPSIGVNWLTEQTFAGQPNGGTVLSYGGINNPTAMRVIFNDSNPAAPTATWENTAKLPTASIFRVLGDPILYTDRDTGRTLFSQLLGGSKFSTIDISDDDGRTFKPSQGAGINSGVDHQTLGGGHFAKPAPSGASYPNAIYYCAQDVAYANCAISLDGGTTFGPAVPIYTVNDCAGLHGHVKVAPDGTAYIPNRGCGGSLPYHENSKQAVVVSENNGTTWEVRPVPSSTGNGNASESDPSLGIASDGTLYLGYKANDGRARIAVSKDKGATWINDFDVSAQVGVRNSVFPAVVAGDPGRAAYAFFGTTTGGSNYDQDAFPGVWYLYIATTYDGGKTWTTVNATPGDPVQRGGICGDDPCRNLLDFFDATIDKRGRVLVGYDDGCISPGCIAGTAGNDRTAKAAIARQIGGRRMFAAYDPTCAAPTPTPSATATPTPTASPTPTNDPRCNPPGTLVVADPAGDQTANVAGATSAHDVRSVSLAERYTAGGGAELVVTMRVESLSSTPPPNTNWRTFFSATHADGTTTKYFVTATTANPPGITYKYGFVDTTATGTSNLTYGDADSGSFSPADGTFTITLSLDKLKKPVAGTPNSSLTGPTVDLSGGKQLSAVNGVVTLLAGTGLTGGSNVSMDTTSNGFYTMAGSAVCPAAATPTPTATPTPSPTATPLVPVSAARYLNYAPPFGYGESSGEPTIGYNLSTKRAMYVAGLQTLQVTFPENLSPALPEAGPAQWKDVSHIVTKTKSLDPILFTDQRTNRTFVSQLNSISQVYSLTGNGLTLIGMNSLMAYTDDDGATWTPAQINPPDGSYDHQTVGAGPYPALVPLGNAVNKGSAVYYCAQAGLTAFCSRSDNGGLTFNRPVPIYTAVGVSGVATNCGGIHGHVKVAPDGTVYVPNYNCGGKQGVAVSTDAGTTWTVRQVTGSLPPTSGILDPSVAISQAAPEPGGTSNTIYFAYTGRVPGGNGTDNHVFVSVSRDRGVTWSAPRDVGAGAGINNAVFATAIAGDADRAAVAFIGTTTSGDHQAASFKGTWYGFVAHTYDGGQTWTTVNATPNGPVQREACIWNGGGTNDCRNLLDFNGVTADERGRVLFGFADGCINECETGGRNTYSSKATIARQSGGTGLFKQFDSPEPVKARRPYLEGRRDDLAAYLTWARPDNGGSPITGYKIYRGTAPGNEVLIGQAAADATSFNDRGGNVAVPSYTYKVTAITAQGESPASNTVSLTVGPRLEPTGACALPGVTAVVDPAGDANGNQPFHDITSISLAEPENMPGKLVFMIKVANLSTVPPGWRWAARFSAPQKPPAAAYGATEDWFVSMITSDGAAPAFTYGSTGAPQNLSRVFTTLGTLDAASNVNADGTITLVLPKSVIGNPEPGKLITNILGSVRATVPSALPGTGGTNETIPDSTGAGQYQLRTSTLCLPNTAPVAFIRANTNEGPAPLAVTFDGSASLDYDAIDTISRYTFNFGDGTDDVSGTSPTVTYTFAQPGEYLVQMVVTDSRGKTSANTARMVVHVLPSGTARLEGYGEGDGERGEIAANEEWGDGLAPAVDSEGSFISTHGVIPPGAAGMAEQRTATPDAGGARRGFITRSARLSIVSLLLLPTSLGGGMGGQLPLAFLIGLA